MNLSTTMPTLIRHFQVQIAASQSTPFTVGLLNADKLISTDKTPGSGSFSIILVIKCSLKIFETPKLREYYHFRNLQNSWNGKLLITQPHSTMFNAIALV